MIRTIWIKPHEAVESFGWTFLDDFDVLKLYLNGLPAKTAEVSNSHFLGKNCLPWRSTERKKYILHLKTSKGE